MNSDQKRAAPGRPDLLEQAIRVAVCQHEGQVRKGDREAVHHASDRSGTPVRAGGAERDDAHEREGEQVEARFNSTFVERLEAYAAVRDVIRARWPDCPLLPGLERELERAREKLC